jgi:hypothetical protein
MIDKVLDDVIKVLKETLYCDKCGEYPKKHSTKIEYNLNYYDDEYIEVCNKCKDKE